MIMLVVLTMESQADSLNQLTTDDLEGKVAFTSFSFSIFAFKFLPSVEN